MHRLLLAFVTLLLTFNAIAVECIFYVTGEMSLLENKRTTIFKNFSFKDSVKWPNVYTDLFGPGAVGKKPECIEEKTCIKEDNETLIHVFYGGNFEPYIRSSTEIGNNANIALWRMKKMKDAGGIYWKRMDYKYFEVTDKVDFTADKAMLIFDEGGKKHTYRIDLMCTRTFLPGNQEP